MIAGYFAANFMIAAFFWLVSYRHMKSLGRLDYFLGREEDD